MCRCKHVHVRVCIPSRHSHTHTYAHTNTYFAHVSELHFCLTLQWETLRVKHGHSASYCIADVDRFGMDNSHFLQESFLLEGALFLGIKALCHSPALPWRRAHPGRNDANGHM
jgi:hypothetical protein